MIFKISFSSFYRAGRVEWGRGCNFFKELKGGPLHPQHSRHPLKINALFCTPSSEDSDDDDYLDGFAAILPIPWSRVGQFGQVRSGQFAAVYCCLLLFAAICYCLLLFAIICCCLPLLLPLAAFSHNLNPKMRAEWSPETPKWLQNEPRMVSKIAAWSTLGASGEPFRQQVWKSFPF